MKRVPFCWLVAAAVMAAPWVGPSYAAIMPLSDLLVGGASIQSGDKIFTNFGYSKTGDMPSAEGVNVETIQDDNGDYGLRFQGGFVDQAGGDSSDAFITFDVSVEEGANMLINQMTLRANTAVFGGTGLASVTETFVPTIVDDRAVVFDFGDGNVQLVDTVDFGQGYTTLPVQKDIILHATGETGAVTVSFVDQIFPQVPEPSGIVLLSVALLCLGRIRRQIS